MWKILLRLNKNLIYAIPLMLCAGFFAGLIIPHGTVMQLKVMIVPLTFLMVYPMMVTLNIAHLKKGLDLKLQGATQFINFFVIPFVAYGLSRLFFPGEPGLALGLLLAALVPTSGMTISWTGFAGGNMGAAINMTVLGLTLGSLATPIYIRQLLGAEVEVDFIRVMQQIVFIVFLPMAAGYVTRILLLRRYSLPEFKKQIAPRFPALSTLGVLGIVFVAMALKAGTIVANPTIILKILLPLLILYCVNFGISTLVGRSFFIRGDGIALVYGTVMRNLSIALAIAMNSFGTAGSSAALVIALAYIIQVQSAAWYVRFTGRIFGEKPVAAGHDIE